MKALKCTVCDTEFFVSDSSASIIGVECPSCGAKEELPNLLDDGLCSMEDIMKSYDIVSNFNNQLLCEEKETERLVSFLSCGNNKYRMLG